MEEDIDMKNQFGIKDIPNPTNIRKAVSKNFVDILFNVLSILKSTAHVVSNDKNLDCVPFVEVNTYPAVAAHLTSKLYVDKLIQEPTLMRNNKNNDFNSYSLSIISQKKLI